jgi:hypothetical protein
MRYIRFYRFSPSSQPPVQIHQLYSWFKEELTHSSIIPVASFEIDENTPLHGNAQYLTWTKQILKGLSILKKAFLDFRNRRS